MVAIIVFPTSLNLTPLEAPLDAPPFPDAGSDFPLNQFYLRYSSAEGWIGESYISIHSISDIYGLVEHHRHYFDAGFHLFGSDGAGEFFGFRTEPPGAPVIYVMPMIGEVDDAIPAGDWNSFLEKLESGSLFDAEDI